MDINALYTQFTKQFGPGGEIAEFRAPGRVNLIGEHTDYNGGLCFPCALSLGTTGLARKRDDGLVRLSSLNFDAPAAFDIESIHYEKRDGWANYPKGVISEIIKLGFDHITGIDIMITGDLPVSAGLSSSASIELLTSVILNDMYGLNLSMLDMVKLSQRAENQFVGVNCGIMDQFAVGMGKKDYAILLDCLTLGYEYAPLNLTGMSIIIANTKYQRGLADSKYNERRAECERSVSLLNKGGLQIGCLGELTPEMFEENKPLIDDPVLQKRAAHVVYEDDRVRRAAECLKTGGYKEFGRLLNESHESLKELYEVTGVHLDALAEAAQKSEGCLGSRMTGAGFGGCTVSIVEDAKCEAFVKTVGEGYKAATGLDAEFYMARAADGAMRVR